MASFYYSTRFRCQCSRGRDDSCYDNSRRRLGNRDFIREDIHGTRNHLRNKLALIREYQAMIADELLDLEYIAYCIGNTV